MQLTGSQSAAVSARGNVIVVAGAGTGKTSALVARCLDLVRKGTPLDRILMVTFTEAAAAEMRHRLRLELQQLVEEAEGTSEHERLTEQLALVETVKISTIHSFCLQLVQAHFHELGLDPDVKVLDNQQCRTLRRDVMRELMDECYRGTLSLSEAVQALVAAYAPDRDSIIHDLVLKLHDYTRSIPNGTEWVQHQRKEWAADSSDTWGGWLIEAFKDWRAEWQPALEARATFKNLGDCLGALNAAGNEPDVASVRQATEAILAADAADWNRKKGTMRKPFSRFFDEAEFLASVSTREAMESDWRAVQHHMEALLSLTAAFTERFTQAKRELGGVDFPDLEQLSLQLLLDGYREPTAVAREWQARMDFVFVDECQDINGAQDAILSALSRSGPDANRFLVGDVKQSIYQFRLADPQIFRNYESAWSKGCANHRISLTENFRSRPGVIDFVNTLFSRLMRDSLGGVAYEPLQVGSRSATGSLKSEPCVELHFIRKTTEDGPEDAGGGDNELADLSAIELEARLVASRISELKASKFAVWDKLKQCERAVEWGDMAVLMRSPGPRTEAYAKVFHEAGIPLAAERGGFLETSEIRDLLSLLQLLDNPLQDIPLLTVLRSPLVGLTLNELATIRSESKAKPFWRALRKFAEHDSDVPPEGQTHEESAISRQAGMMDRSPNEKSNLLAEHRQHVEARVAEFLCHFTRWRELIRQVGPSLCLEQILTDTNYDVLLQANPRRTGQVANVRRFLDLARQFDPYLRQGLYRFLKYLKALSKSEESLEPAPVPSHNAVRLTSIHKSKGLEFPVVVLAGLGSRFNLPELNGLVLLDSKFGLAPRAMNTTGTARYPTLPFWLAERHQRQQRLGEELRLLYVAATRARDRLICTGVLSRKDQGRWESQPGKIVTDHEMISARCPLDWLFAWLPAVTQEAQWQEGSRGASDLTHWELWDPQDPRLQLQAQKNDCGSVEMSSAHIDPANVKTVTERLSWIYPQQAATVEPAKSSVSALRRRATELIDEDAVNRFEGFRSKTRHHGRTAKISAAQRGILHHRFLQNIEIESGHSETELAGQLKTLVERRVFSSEEAAEIDLKRIAAFWNSEVGRQIGKHASGVRRELPFTMRMDDAGVRSVLGQTPDARLADEFIVVQGVVDLVVMLEHEVWLLDFKTDDVSGKALQGRAREYEPQLGLYSTALEQIYGKPVRHQWLHFLATGETLEIAGLGATKVCTS